MAWIDDSEFLIAAAENVTKTAWKFSPSRSMIGCA